MYILNGPRPPRTNNRCACCPPPDLQSPSLLNAPLQNSFLHHFFVQNTFQRHLCKSRLGTASLWGMRVMSESCLTTRLIFSWMWDMTHLCNTHVCKMHSREKKIHFCQTILCQKHEKAHLCTKNISGKHVSAQNAPKHISAKHTSLPNTPLWQTRFCQKRAKTHLCQTHLSAKHWHAFQHTKNTSIPKKKTSLQKESRHIWMSQVSYEWVMSHVNESCLICTSHMNAYIRVTNTFLPETPFCQTLARISANKTHICAKKTISAKQLTTRTHQPCNMMALTQIMSIVDMIAKTWKHGAIRWGIANRESSRFHEPYMKSNSAVRLVAQDFLL